MAKEPTSVSHWRIRFVSQPEDAISPHSYRRRGLGGDNASLVVYGSRHPYWDSVSAEEVFAGWSAEERAVA